MDIATAALLSPLIALVDRKCFGQVKVLCDLTFWVLVAGRLVVWKSDCDCLFVSAYFGGKPADKMNNHFSAAVCELHVQAVGTLLWCHHETHLRKNKAHTRGSAAEEPPRTNCGGTLQQMLAYLEG